ncbi:MAG: ankyrin repeat domain-containing protein [Legionellaceae bacterium]|nr:ankyrin repeat domain-containing protein [Legionellaceae bacterium]
MRHHSALIAAAKALGYIADSGEAADGLCHGATLRCIESYLIDEPDAFIERVNLIRQTPDLKTRIETTKEKVILHELLTPDDLKHLDVLAFYDSLLLYQNPNLYEKLFGRMLAQGNFKGISQLAASTAAHAAGGFARPYSEPNIFTQDELRTYLHDLQQIVEQHEGHPPKNIGFVLSSYNHSIALNYQAKEKKWTLMDINQWPPLTLSSTATLDAFAPRITQAFHGSRYTGFSTRAITLKPHKNRALTKALKTLRKKYSVTKDTSKRQINGATLAHLAAQTNSLKTIKQLAAFKADFNKQTAGGETPLFYAAHEGFPRIIYELVKHGADPNIPDINGVTPLGKAAFYGNLKTFQALADCHANLDCARVGHLSCAEIAARTGHVSILAELLNRGIDLAQTDTEGKTLAHFAAEYGHLRVLRFLAEKDAPIHARNHLGSGPIFFAASKGQAHVIDELVKRGSDVNQVNKKGYTPAFIAAYNGRSNVLAKLAQYGVDLTQRAPDGRTLIEVAKARGHRKAVAELEKHTATAATLTQTKARYKAVIASIKAPMLVAPLIAHLKNLQHICEKKELSSEHQNIEKLCQDMIQVLNTPSSLDQKIAILTRLISRTASPTSIAASAHLTTLPNLKLSAQKSLQAMVQALSEAPQNPDALDKASRIIESFAAALEEDRGLLPPT